MECCSQNIFWDEVKKGKKSEKKLKQLAIFLWPDGFQTKIRILFESLIIRSGLNSFDVRTSRPEV